MSKTTPPGMKTGRHPSPMKYQPDGRKYHAFISYSHVADGNLAPAVQAALERFGQPWYSRARVQVFRDQTDLALTPDLPREIQRALERSELLILLAGPAGARSPWVEQEVRFWLQHRSASRILIVRTGGELHWGEVTLTGTERPRYRPVSNKSSRASPCGPT